MDTIIGEVYDQERVGTVIVESYEWRLVDSITEHLFWTGEKAF